MNLANDIEALRAHLATLAAENDAHLRSRYRLQFPPPETMSLYTRFRRAVGRVLRDWGLRRTRPPEPWLVALKHAPAMATAKPLLVWAVGADAGNLRQACEGIDRLIGTLPGYAPVLVTDIADFAFYSRLGWLVEYIPSLEPPGQDYAKQKQAYIAWLYRQAPAVPSSAGLHGGIRVEDLQIG